MSQTRIFVGFASRPELLADTIRSAANEIDRLPDVEVRNWENFRVGGTVLLETIEREIRAAAVAVVDLTQLNENVLFEFGLALGANKVVWPLRDASDTTCAAEWKAVGLFDTLGQTRFTNSDQIVGRFASERPDLQGTALFSTTLTEEVVGARPASVFYVAETHQTDAGRRTLELLEAEATKAVPLVVSDPNEARVATLPWYIQQVYTCEAAIVHLASQRREGSVVHNARASFIAGLARGMKRPLLMLAEQDHVAALDYKDLLFRYPTATECRTRVQYWLTREVAHVHQRVATVRDEAEALKFSTELRSVDLGEYVAENEANGLSRYFLETASFREVLSGASRVYVGAKGSGKSATVIQSATAIQQDKRNLVCVIKPAGYDLDGLVRLLERYNERDSKGYVAESLWKFLLATELALAVERDLTRRAAGVVPSTVEWELVNFIAENAEWIKLDFAARLEQCVERMLDAPRQEMISDEHAGISEALHAGPLRGLRNVLSAVLATRRRTFIVIDNLDKAWDAGAEATQLARVILGLLACMDAFRRDLAGAGEGIDVSLSLFLRSDIFKAVAAQAREPDKLPVRHLRWEEQLLLLDVIEERYLASRPEEAPRGELWSRFFCDAVKGVPVREWLLLVCLPRPRDLLFFCRAAIDHAVTERHSMVEVDDLLAAEHQYSLFAFEAAAVECQQRFSNSEGVLLEFAGAPTSLTAVQLADVLSGARVPLDKHATVIDALRDVSFLGVVTGDGVAAYADTTREKQKANVLARKAAADHDGVERFQIHPAFWAYLEVTHTAELPNLGV